MRVLREPVSEEEKREARGRHCFMEICPEGAYLSSKMLCGRQMHVLEMFSEHLGLMEKTSELSA